MTTEKANINDHLRILIGFVIVFQILSTGALAQEEPLRVDTNLVTIPVTVVSRDGRYVDGLTKEKFKIFEDKVEQDIAYFQPVDEPFTVLLLMDISGSMLDYMNDLARSANSFVQNLRPDDVLIAVTFSDQINTLIQPTSVRNLTTGIKLKPKNREGDTIIYDAVDFAVKRIKRVRGRKAIVFFSDGIGVGIATAKGTLRLAEEQEALIYTIQFGTFPENPSSSVSKKYYLKRISEINDYMRDLALKTGGRSYHIEKISDLDTTFERVTQELGRVYSIGYSPPKVGKEGERRKITVKVDVPNVAVRSRSEVVYKRPKS